MENYSIKDYWNSEWTKRCKGGTLAFNFEKVGKLLHELMAREDFAEKEKLEIGCGFAIHAYIMSIFLGGWRKHYTGIDVSSEAIRVASGFGLNVFEADIFNFKPDRKFDVFLLLDSLEHIKDLDGLADRIASFSNDRFLVWGNVPLFTGKNAHSEEVEFVVTPELVEKFLAKCGMDEYTTEIYGVNNYPFMIFEGRK